MRKDDEKGSSDGRAGEGAPGEQPHPPEKEPAEAPEEEREEGARPGEGQVRPYQQVPRNPLDHGGINE
jgi:hypothetical protein